MTSSPDWLRLEKALTVEAERGYRDIMGKQYRFSEFLRISFSQTVPHGTKEQQEKWKTIGDQFSYYETLNPIQRQNLVTSAHYLIKQLQQISVESKYPVKQPKTVAITSTQPTNHYDKIILDRKLHEIYSIGKRYSAYLERLNLQTVKDVLFYYPRDYIDYARQVNIKELKAGETVTLIGTVKRCSCFTSPKNSKLTIFEMVIKDNTGQLKINRFYAGTRYSSRGWQESQKKVYQMGTVVATSGLVKETQYGLTLDNPEIEVLSHINDHIESTKIGRVLPVYPLTEGVTADVVRKAVITCLPASRQICDPFPVALRNQYGLMGLKESIEQIHFPKSNESLAFARRRLVFDEFFYLQLGFLSRRKQQKRQEESAIFTPRGELLENFKTILPFTLTNAQNRVINEILKDLASPTPMNRLVQGDVGSGKTIVAVFAILAAIQSGYQTALMAPTEVLAEQHYRKIVSWFNLLHLPVELLTGSTRTAKRREIHAQLDTGELPLLVGTHALIQDTVNFKQLGLVVIDEQHRFGVQQRARLLSKGRSPHVLTMTATPIPRTLALTIHGDLDTSQIDELPPGRQPIQTTALTGKQRQEAYDLIRREIAQGRQCYIVLPMIEESEKLDVRAATAEYERLSEVIFPNYNLGLLHGKMSSIEKDEVLNAFRDNRIQILVSTTVVEVGVDVPNATVMLIENAERFGLSQLHQLRGRVGRGKHESYCLLMSSAKNPDSRQRLAVLEQSQDGFFISEMDMRFRGPGEVLGTRQSGLPDFALASLVDDQEILNLARQAAEKMMMVDRTLEDYPLIKKELEERYQKLLGNLTLS